jgi:hypothetical protein
MRRSEGTAEIAKHAEKILLCVVCVLGGFFFSWPVSAQDEPPVARTTRLAVLQAEDRRAPTPRDLGIIRSGLHGDAQTIRAAVRALGRLERPALIPDILPSLRHALPEIRSEAANAIGQAAQGWKGDKAPAASTLDGVSSALTARLKVEAEPDVREAICDTIGRLPYVNATQVDAAEQTLIELAGRETAAADRLGVALGLEGLARTQKKLRAPGEGALALSRRLVLLAKGEAVTGARIRRLALEALTTAGAVDAETLAAATHDPDAQVRR